MASKKTAAILTMVGGIFYIIGGIALAGLVLLFSSLGSGLTGSGSENVCSFISSFPCDSNVNATGIDGFGGFGAGLGAIANIILVIGVVSGGLIIFSGWLIASENSGRRKIGAVLAIIFAVVGAFTTLGGLVIGFILAAIGVYYALTYKARISPMTIPFGGMASVTLGPQTIPAQTNTQAGSGPLNYCTKCGSQIRPGSVFCGACGARLAD